MTATTDSASAASSAHPRTRSMESWRARLGVLASRGETDGPRVDEARAALSWWRRHASLMRTLDISAERAESLLDLIAEDPDTATDTEAVTR